MANARKSLKFKCQFFPTYFVHVLWNCTGLDVNTLDSINSRNIMYGCCQGTSHYLSQCWHIFMPSYGVARSQWVKSMSMVISRSIIHCFLWKKWFRIIKAKCLMQMPVFSKSAQHINYLGICLTWKQRWHWWWPGICAHVFAEKKVSDWENLVIMVVDMSAIIMFIATTTTT